MPGKVIKFDQATLAELTSLASDTMMDFQELAEEAFRDLLKKHGRPVDLKDALKRSVRDGAGTVAGQSAQGGAAPRPCKRSPGTFVDPWLFVLRYNGSDKCQVMKMDELPRLQ